jgi:hypothetical protein
MASSTTIAAYSATRMADVISSILATAGTPGSNHVVEFLAVQLKSVSIERIGWPDLSTTERTLLRFAWEYVHRTTCPFPLHPDHA